MNHENLSSFLPTHCANAYHYINIVIEEGKRRGGFIREVMIMFDVQGTGPSLPFLSSSLLISTLQEIMKMLIHLCNFVLTNLF